MNEVIKTVKNFGGSPDYSHALLFGKTQAEHVKKYHQSFPVYKPTELKNLKYLSKHLGLGALYIKDESTRFGLNAFKGLGGSYCIGRYIGEKCGKYVSDEIDKPLEIDI